jgi:hypothetical protein
MMADFIDVEFDHKVAWQRRQDGVREKEKGENKRARMHANRKKNAKNNSVLHWWEGVYVLRRRAGNVEGKKEGHKTDQEYTVRSHTIITAINHTRVYFRNKLFFFSLSLSLFFFLHAY